jgi:hypothetical protein
LVPCPIEEGGELSIACFQKGGEMPKSAEGNTMHGKKRAESTATVQHDCLLKTCINDESFATVFNLFFTGMISCEQAM